MQLGVAARSYLHEEGEIEGSDGPVWFSSDKELERRRLKHKKCVSIGAIDLMTAL